MNLRIFLLTLLSFKLYSNDFMTTRLMSTGGAGVGALLINEANILNPASVAFFKNNSVYYQKHSSEIENESSSRTSQNLDYPSDSNGHLFILTDTSSENPGSLGYMTYRGVGYDRKRINFSFARPIGKDSSFGTILRKTKDYIHSGGEESYYQAVFGVTHILNENISFGLVLQDPFKSNKNETSITLGFQFVISQHLYFLSDFGGFYKDSLSENKYFRNAFQIRFLEDFYIRLGLFQDESKGTKGDGWGFSWAGPKLNLDFATLTHKPDDESKKFIFNNETIIETSFTISIVI